MLFAIGVAMAANVVVVVSPGVAFEAYEPLVTALSAAGHTVAAHEFPCTGSIDDQVGALRAHLDEVGPHVLVAHGLGAWLALRAASPATTHSVLLAPLLDHWPVLASAEDPDALWGHRPPSSCVSPLVADEVRGWLRTGAVPTDHLGAVGHPVWVAVGANDDLAGVEAVVPASRLLPGRKLVRMGVKRLDPIDYDHGQMLTEPGPIRVAVEATLP